MQAVFKDFYDTLCENLEKYAGEYESFIDYGPVLFKLLCNLLNCEVDRSLKLPVCGAIAYYVTPDDVIPDGLGPYGYIDDIYLSSLVLKMVADAHGYAFIQAASDTAGIEDIIKQCFDKSRELLSDEEISRIMDYVGL